MTPKPSATRRLTLAVALLSVGAACSDGDDARDLTADDRRFCEVTDSIEAAAEETFSKLGEDATEDQTAAAQKALLRKVEGDLEEMEEVAPDAIADDVASFVQFFRASMNGEDVEEVSDERMVAWEEANCPEAE